MTVGTEAEGSQYVEVLRKLYARGHVVPGAIEYGIYF